MEPNAIRVPARAGRIAAWKRGIFLLIFPMLTHAASAAVQYQTTNDWGTGFNGQISVRNDTGVELSSWTLEFDFDRDVNLIWNAVIASKTDNHYVIKPAGWNGQLEAGASLSFGFGGAPGNVTSGPRNFTFNGTPVSAPAPDPAPMPPPEPTSTSAPAPTGGIVAIISETSVWSGGFGANLTITNTGTTAVNSWKLSFGFDHEITALWNGTLSAQGSTYTVSNASWTASIPVGGSVVLGFNGSGDPTTASATNCVFNGAPCTIRMIASPPGPSPSPTQGSILIGTDSTSIELTIPQSAVSYPLSLTTSGAPNFTVSTSNPSVVSASIGSGNVLQLSGVAAGRAGLKLQDTATGSVRYVGIRVRNSDGSIPGLPSYLALGSVSEDTTDHLSFWQSFGPGATNKRVDIRYIYLNGGPVNGWDTWSNTPGGRAVTYIRNSRQYGMIPFFVFYNIADGGESYYTDLSHVQNTTYMQAYFRNLKLALDIINQESKDNPVGMILEPDFLGYLAQNANQPASEIPAMTNAVYSSGILTAGVDPAFADNVQGLVRAINYTISKYTPQAYFGWQMNLWASPAGGWTTSIPGKGIIHKTDSLGVAAGRPLIYQEAAAVTKYYLDAGVTSYSAKFLSIDKYGLDATGYESSAALDPAGSTWFWNNDQWQNYLTFVRAMHDTSQLPVVLWQLPVGHINSSRKANPYSQTGVFPDLTDNSRMLEDSTSTFFFGDTFQTSGARFTFFATNSGADPSLAVSGSEITWGPHWNEAAAAGVTAALFGAGVGASTTNAGNPPTDSYWWITGAQNYFMAPVRLR